MVKAVFYMLLSFLSACGSSPRVADPAVFQEAKVKLLASEHLKNAPLRSQQELQNFKFKWEDRSFSFFQAPVVIPPDDEFQGRYGFGPVFEVERHPLRGVKQAKSKRWMDLSQRFRGYIISKVFQDEYNQRIWILLELAVDNSSRSYVVWISEDGGDHWFQGADLVRPSPEFPPSELRLLVLDGAGNGEAWFALNTHEHTTQQTIDADLKLGQERWYKSVTEDGGRSWRSGSQPTLSNGLIEVLNSVNEGLKNSASQSKAKKFKK